MKHGPDNGSLGAALRRRRTWVLLALTVVIGSWVATQAKPQIVRDWHDPVQDTGTPAGALTEHLVIISIDGLRPDAIERYGAVALQRLMTEGRFAVNARTVDPSKTLPSHASMLTGFPPAVHGLSWNADSTASRGYIDVPTIFTQGRAYGLLTAAFYAKTKFEHLSGPGGLDHVQRPRGGWMGIWAEDVKRDVAYYLSGHRPNLLFVHIGDPDFLGHVFGWMSPVYGHGVREADDAVATIVAAGDAAFGRDGWTLIVTADHGGTGTDHVSGLASDVRVPWIVRGKGVGAGAEITEPISQMRTAATALWLLGVPASDSVLAVPVVSPFATPSRPARTGSAAH